MAQSKSFNEGHATLVEQNIERIEKSANAQIRRIERATDAQLRKGAKDAGMHVHKEKLEQLLEKTEAMADRLGDFVVFRKIRHMGKQSKRFFVLIVASAVVLYWLGLWNLYDLFWEYVLPHNRIISALISMTIGASVLVGTGKLIDALGPVDVEMDEEIIIRPLEKNVTARGPATDAKTVEPKN
ncbi:hypothetical protein HY994_00120 [Candidatus Micrarchaeota archaeon]|nr:hypothetical protein [Candidatus Micrarchaeota archaeon]